MRLIATCLAAATLAAPALAQEDTGGRFPNGRPMLAEGRYAEWPGDGSNPCTTGTPRTFRLIPGNPDNADDFGRILIDLGEGPAEYGLISAELQDTPIQVWDLAGLATVHAADAAGTRLTALMYFRNDGRTDLVDARTTSPENEGEVMVRMQQNPEPHGVLSDGTTLNPFVWCGRD